MGPWGWLSMIVFWLVVVAVAVWVVGRLFPVQLPAAPRAAPPAPEAAAEVHPVSCSSITDEIDGHGPVEVKGPR